MDLTAVLAAAGGEGVCTHVHMLLLLSFMLGIVLASSPVSATVG